MRVGICMRWVGWNCKSSIPWVVHDEIHVVFFV
jgi:hypothetical protein